VVWECSFRLASEAEVASRVAMWLKSGEDALTMPLQSRKRNMAD
jgi:hypothetical protein